MKYYATVRFEGPNTLPRWTRRPRGHFASGIAYTGVSKWLLDWCDATREVFPSVKKIEWWSIKGPKR